MMQIIIYIPNIAALVVTSYIDETGALTIYPSHIVGAEALAVVGAPVPGEIAPHVTPIGQVVNVAGEPAASIDPAHQATYDRLWPRTPVVTPEGTFTPPALFGCLGTPPPAPDIALLHAAAERYIDDVADEVRKKYASDIAFQLEAYNRKAQDAVAFLALTPPRPVEATGYPWLGARLIALRVANPAATATDAATDIQATAQAWSDGAAPILLRTEEERERGKAMVRAATTPAAVAQEQATAEAALRAL